MLRSSLCTHCSTKWYWKVPCASFVVQSSTGRCFGASFAVQSSARRCFGASFVVQSSTGKCLVQALQYKCEVSGVQCEVWGVK